MFRLKKMSWTLHSQHFANTFFFRLYRILCQKSHNRFTSIIWAFWVWTETFMWCVSEIFSDSYEHVSPPHFIISDMFDLPLSTNRFQGFFKYSLNKNRPRGSPIILALHLYYSIHRNTEFWNCPVSGLVNNNSNNTFWLHVLLLAISVNNWLENICADAKGVHPSTRPSPYFFFMKKAKQKTKPEKHPFTSLGGVNSTYKNFLLAW